MRSVRLGRNVWSAAAAILGLSAGLLCAADPPAAGTPAAPAAPAVAPAAPEGGLDARQELLAARFRRFEKTLLQMAEYMRKTEPERADLLVRAIGKSKEERISEHMQLVVELLRGGKPQFGPALEQQEELVASLQSLLDLLQSEDRLSELERERKRIEDLLKDLNKVTARQKDVRAATERGEDADDLAKRQDRVAGDTQRLIDKVAGQDAQRNAGKPGEGKPGEGKPGEGKPGEGKPGEGQESDSQKTPGRKEIEQAKREMERAIEELKKKALDPASRNQDEALAKLQQAKEKLEEILRQLREEERELLLAALEARFQKMLALQIIVYNGTVGLSKTPKAEWNENVHGGRSRELARQEDEIGLEAVKALEILKAEGSSVAFPEAVEQLRTDILSVARRLERQDVGQVTQAVERDIIESLEELIEALQKEMEKEKEKKDPKDGKPKDGKPDDPSLVDKLAELKMLRSLQLRINRRTKSLGQAIDGEQATQVEVVDQLKDLAQRQARVQQATYDLATGRNK